MELTVLLILSRRNRRKDTENARKLHDGCADRIRPIRARVRRCTPPQGQELAVEPEESKIDKGDGGVGLISSDKGNRAPARMGTSTRCWGPVPMSNSIEKLGSMQQELF